MKYFILRIIISYDSDLMDNLFNGFVPVKRTRLIQQFFPEISKL